MINQQWLQTFLTLVEVGHFTQTAEKLYMTQPGVSQQIKKLEEQVGVALLKRTGKSNFPLMISGICLIEKGFRGVGNESYPQCCINNMTSDN